MKNVKPVLREDSFLEAFALYLKLNSKNKNNENINYEVKHFANCLSSVDEINS